MSDIHAPDRPVDRCLCLGLVFSELKDLAEKRRLHFEELQRATRCSTGCGMCEPYIRLMLQTGETRFPVLSPTDLAAACADENTSDEP